jgi:DNA-binding CsgD family transcriptional regulator
MTKPTTITPSIHNKLSRREAQIIGLIADGLSNKQIADKLGVNTHTVESIRLRASYKLGLTGTAQLTKYAIAFGLSQNQFEQANETITIQIDRRLALIAAHQLNPNT